MSAARRLRANHRGTVNRNARKMARAEARSARSRKMHKERHSILDGIGPLAGSRSRVGFAGWVLRLTGVILLVGTSALIVIAPAIMSRNTFTAVEVIAVGLGATYAILLAAHSRRTQAKLERAYSAHLEELSQRLRTMAYQDALTGLYNHRYFHEQLGREIERSIRYAQPLALLLMDMNNFKAVNDTFGHMIGDKFLSLVGQVITDGIRSSDIGARYGGDEFVVILPNTTAAEARLTAEKLAASVAAAAALTPGDEHVQLGVSIGVAVCPDDTRAAADLLRIADSRLYEVKAARGRRRDIA